MDFYNIAKGVAVNPFEGVKYVRFAENCIYSAYEQTNKFRHIVHDKFEPLGDRKVNGIYHLLFPIACLDLTVGVKWNEGITSGKIYIRGFIHGMWFTIEGDTIVLS